MTDMLLLEQAQSAFQNAQSQKGLAAINSIATGEKPNFAETLNAQQMKDPSQVDVIQRRKIHETAVDFEAQFLSQMLQPMFEGIEVSEPFGGGHAEKMWQGMLVNEYGKSLAKSGGIGLADHVERQLLRAQEGL
jgi:Rod binding domain-containing protein